jgi:hypothetical protein
METEHHASHPPSTEHCVDLDGGIKGNPVDWLVQAALYPRRPTHPTASTAIPASARAAISGPAPLRRKRRARIEAAHPLQVYPLGSRAESEAAGLRKFAVAVKRGVDPASIIAGARVYGESARRNVADAPFTERAQTSLTQEAVEAAPRAAGAPACAGVNRGSSADDSQLRSGLLR